MILIMPIITRIALMLLIFLPPAAAAVAVALVAAMVSAGWWWVARAWKKNGIERECIGCFEMEQWKMECLIGKN